MSRVALVTGSSGGVGSATCSVFKHAGWQVVGADLVDPVDDRALSHFVKTDVCAEENVSHLFERLSRSYAKLDALVNNAAIYEWAPLSNMRTEDWESAMASNLRSAFLMCRTALPLMTEGAAIVNVSSIHAFATTVGATAYASTKGALISFTRALALEVAARRVRVNAVVPGAIDTPMLRQNRQGSREESAGLDALVERHPLGRLGRPQDVAEAILFLCDSERSSFITGQSLVIDGGAYARLSTD